MIDINILTRNDNVFDGDSIYSVMLCDDDEVGIKKCIEKWNSGKNDICGLMTGGMYFIHQGQPINEYFIERNLEHYQVILPYEEPLSEDVIRSFYSVYEDYISQCDELIEEINCKYPELVEGIKAAVASKYYVHSNMVIGYSSKLCDLYKYIENIDVCKYSPLLISLIIKGWVIAKGVKVRSVEISNNSPDIWNCGYRKIEVIQNYVDVVLKDYIHFRKTEGFADGFAGENPYQGDFAGKKPIWMCWWQGEEEMPALIKACVESVKRNAPSNTTVILITLNNVREYVTFTDSIIDNFNNEKISYTHLSDILRAELVYRYGGMWIDATYYVPHKMDEQFFDDRLFSLAFKKPLWGMDIMRGRWTLSVLGAERENIAVQFLMEGLWYYWDNSDELADYFLVDYIFDAGYRNFDNIRSNIDSIRRCSNAVYDLQLKMNQSFDDKDLQWLRTGADFYKLNRRNEYSDESIRGNKTFYSYIVNEDCYVSCKKAENLCIECSSYVDFIKKIRAINPKKILDYSKFLMKDGRISRGLLTDFLCDECEIDVYEDANNYVGDYSFIFDSIANVPEQIRKEIEVILNNKSNGTYLVRLGDYTVYDMIIVEK